MKILTQGGIRQRENKNKRRNVEGAQREGARCKRMEENKKNDRTRKGRKPITMRANLEREKRHLQIERIQPQKINAKKNKMRTKKRNTR